MKKHSFDWFSIIKKKSGQFFHREILVDWQSKDFAQKPIWLSSSKHLLLVQICTNITQVFLFRRTTQIISAGLFCITFNSSQLLATHPFRSILFFKLISEQQLPLFNWSPNTNGKWTYPNILDCSCTIFSTMTLTPRYPVKMPPLEMILWVQLKNALLVLMLWFWNKPLNIY